MKIFRTACFLLPSLVLGVLCLHFPAAAQQGPTGLYPPENLLQFDFRASYFDYREDLPAPLKSTESGWLPGGVASWTRTRPGAVYSRAFLELSSGDLEYDGTTQTGRPITDSSSNHLLFRVEADIGYTFQSGNALFSPYAGLGYRYWKRGESKVLNSVAFVREDYYWLYVPVGLRAVFPVGERMTLEPDAGARLMFHGRMKAYLTDIDPNYGSDPVFDLGNKPGFFFAAPIRYRFNRNWSAALTPWYEYSTIGRSGDETVRYGPSSTMSFYEPSSRTHQFGLNIGAGYFF